MVIPDDVKLSVEVNRTNHGTLEVKGKIDGNIDAAAYNENNGTYYGSVERAIENASDGSIIDVLRDTEETNNYVGFDDNWNLVGNNSSAIENLENNITVNLNGHNVKANLENSTGKSLTIVDETGKGTLDGDITNNGDLVIENGNFTGEITTEDGASTVLNGGTFSDNVYENAEIPENKELVSNGDGTYSLVYKIADYSALEGAVSVAKGLDTSKYTAESVKALLEAIEDAENVDKDIRVNEQYRIDELTKALTTAIANLVEKGSDSTNPGSTTNKPGSSNTDEEDVPNTFDAGLTYVGLALSAVGASVVSIKKLRRN